MQNRVGTGIASLLFIAGLSVMLIAGSGLISPSSFAYSDDSNRVVLTTENNVNIRGPIDSSSMQEAQLKLNSLVAVRGKKDYTIYISLDSPGGSVSAGEDFLAYAESIPNVKTITFFAASMAAIIVQSLPGERLSTPRSSTMFHRASISGLGGQIEDGETESRLAYIKRQIRGIEERISKRMGLTLAEYKQKIVNEYWVYGNEAKTDKVSDRIVQVVCSQPLINARETTQSLIMGLFLVTQTYSGCPLFSSPFQEAEEGE